MVNLPKNYFTRLAILIFVILAITFPRSISAQSFLPGDLDKDGDVDIFDYNLLITNFGATGDNPADIDGDGKKDVIVGFSNAFGNAPAKFNIIEDFPGSNFSGFPIKGRVTVRNTGGQISELQTATIYSKIINPNFQEISINKIPPLGFLTVDVSFDKTPILTNTEDTITITLNGQSISKKIKIVPIFLHKLSIILGGVIVVIVTIILSIIAVKTRRLPFFRQKEQNIVRWESEKSQKSG